MIISGFIIFAFQLRTANIGDFDWKEAINIMIERGIITAEDTKAMDLFTRGDMAKIIFESRAHGLILA